MTDDMSLQPLVKWLLGLLAAFILMGASAVAGAMWSHEQRITKNELAADRITLAVQQSQVSVEVAKQHGEEMLAVRKELTSLREELIANVNVITSLIEKSTDGRYRSSDAAKDKQLVNAQLGAIEVKLQAIIDAMPD